MKKESLCILCGGPSKVLEEYTNEKFVLGYEHRYGNPPKSIFPQYSTMRICKKCKLVYAYPTIGGSNDYYKWVTNHDDYYATNRWEWEKIVEYINTLSQRTIKILEVGCGEGYFLKKIQEECHNVECVGVDMTETSIEKCKAKGLNVFCGTLEDYLERYPNEKYDFVVSFHCLEHVFNPKEYVEEMLNVCKDDGMCINAIPYTVSSKTPWWDVLNSPPHHMTRWRMPAIKELGRQVNCDIDIMAQNTFWAPIEAINMVKQTRYPIYNQPHFKDEKMFIISHYPFLYLHELIRNFFREKIDALDSIGGKSRRITVPYQITMIFHKKDRNNSNNE